MPIIKKVPKSGYVYLKDFKNKTIEIREVTTIITDDKQKIELGSKHGN